MKPDNLASIASARVDPPSLLKPGECILRAGDRLVITIKREVDDVWEILLVSPDGRPGSFAKVLLAFDLDRQQAIGKAQAVLDLGETALGRHLVTGETDG